MEHDLVLNVQIRTAQDNDDLFLLYVMIIRQKGRRWITERSELAADKRFATADEAITFGKKVAAAALTKKHPTAHIKIAG